jgi:Cu/Ag efflux protein CusF
MIKSVLRYSLMAALALGVLGFTGSVRAEDGKKAEKKADKPRQLTGEITAVDPTAGTVTINSKKEGSKTFSVTATTKFGGEGKDITIADLKAGDKVTIHYTEADSKLVASKVGKVDPTKEKKKKEGEAK